MHFSRASRDKISEPRCHAKSFALRSVGVKQLRLNHRLAETRVAFSPAKILVVDDNAANQALAEATLEDEGYQVVLASSGEDALQKLEAELPDCVLLDVRMPGMDGFEVCRRIRSLPRGADLPVVFLTAQRDVDTFDAARDAGADDFLTKPLQPAELVVRVRAAVQFRQMSEALRAQYDIVRQQRDDLMRLQLLKERLTAFLVHDLKNPVGAMDLRAQQALRDSELSERTRSALLHIRDETRTLLRLILNLLDISRSDEGGLSLRREPVDLERLTRSVMEELELRAKLSDVQLRVACESATLSGDADLLRRVLANLVENAIRHAPDESTVHIAVRREQQRLRIEVRDEGRGVPADMRERIFDAFVQAESGENAARTGRGLGLTFCRVAVQAHGGEIHVEEGNPGAVFVITLPVDEN